MLIVGTGPVGLSAAIELASREVNVAVADRARTATLVRAGGRGGLTYDERYDASDVIWYEPGQLEDEPRCQPGHYEDDPRPGHRAPDGFVDPYGGTLHDRIGNALAPLVLADDRSVEQSFAAEAVARSLPFTVVHLADPAGRRLYGAGNVLVRPDQHVAWRGSQLSASGAGAVLDHILGVRRKTTSTRHSARISASPDHLDHRKAPA